MQTFKKIVLFTLLAIATTVVPFVAYYKHNINIVTVNRIQFEVYKLQKEMNLENWSIGVEMKDLSKDKVSSVDGGWYNDIIAKVETIPEYYQAKIYVDQNHLDLVDKHVLMHELYHIHFAEIRNYIISDVATTQDQVNKLHFYEERFVESITRGSKK